jgi:hypothetical protein
LWENPTIEVTSDWLAAFQQLPTAQINSKMKLQQHDSMNVVLGRGFNRFTANIRNSAFGNLKNHPLPPRPLQTSIIVQKMDKLTALRPHLNWWSSAQTATNNSLYKQRLIWLESLTSTEAEQFIAIHFTIASRQRMTTYRAFSPLAETYLTQPMGDYHAFVTRYGDTFIDSYQFGGQLIAILSGKTRILNADLCGLTGRYTCVKSLVKQLAEMHRHLAECRALYVIGGDPASQSGTTLNLLKLLLEFPDQIFPEKGNPTLLGVGVVPYEDLECFPDHFPAICKTNYQHYLKLLNELDHCKIGNVTPQKQFTILNKLQKMATSPELNIFLA